MPHLSTEGLCLAKMLLIKGDYLNGSTVTIDLIERITGIRAPYIAKALSCLLELKIITIKNLQVDKKCVATTTIYTNSPTNDGFKVDSKKIVKAIKTVDDYLDYVGICYDYYSGKRLKDKPTELSSFLLSFDKDKLSDFIDGYLADYRENMAKTKNKSFFKARRDEVRSFIADAIKNEVAKLKAKQKQSININLILNCHSDSHLPHDVVEILMMMEDDNNVIITSIDLFTNIEVDPEHSNVTVSNRCNTVGLLITDWKNNKLIIENNNSVLSVRHKFIDGEIPRSYLQIDDYQEIPTSKLSALIIKYFFDKIKYDKTFKNYHEFKKSLSDDKYKEIKSYDFAKRIIMINRRVNKITKGAVEEIIIKGENSGNEANTYRWFSD